LPCDRWLASSALQKAIRRGEVLIAQRALRTLYRHDPRSAWRRLLIIACEDVGIGALGAVVMTARRSANAKALREMGKDEAAALATSQTLAEAAKDRSADLLFAAALHDPALETMRTRCRSVPVARRLEFVADPTLSLPERAVAAWHSSGVELRGERRVGPGDLSALMRTYAELGVPARLLEAVAIAVKKAREPFTLLLPLLWLTAIGSETEVVDSPLATSGLINDIPLYALDKHTRLGRQAIRRFAENNPEIAQFLAEHGCGSRDDGALRMAVFYAESALTRPTLQWRHAAELTAAGLTADFHSVNVGAGLGAELVELVAAHIADLNAIRIQLLSRALPPDQ
jgi:MgsA AAA+ ATPase C terminal